VFCGRSKPLRHRRGKKIQELMSAPEADINVADECRLSFEVCVKKVPRGQWTMVVECISLREALSRAEIEGNRHVESGVLLQTSSGGMI
jgi:hypothetical protein